MVQVRAKTRFRDLGLEARLAGGIELAPGGLGFFLDPSDARAGPLGRLCRSREIFGAPAALPETFALTLPSLLVLPREICGALLEAHFLLVGVGQVAVQRVTRLEQLLPRAFERPPPLRRDLGLGSPVG